MAGTVQLNNYTDFDRLLIGKNFLITLLGTIASFSLAYFQVYVPLPIPPYNLSLSIVMMMVVSIYTANIASTLLVSIIGSFGLVSASGGPVDLIPVYIWINVLTMVILGYYADKLRLVMYWNRFYLLFAAVFSTIAIAIGLYWNPKAAKYWSMGYSVGNGGDAGTGIGQPVLDLAVLGSIYLLLIIVAILIRGQIQLDNKSIGKYKFFGWLFFLAGQAVTLVPMALFMVEMNSNELTQIAYEKYHLTMIDDLFTHTTGKYAIFGDPLSVFFIMALTVTLTSIGIVLLRIARYEGNMEGAKGSSDTVFLGASFGVLLYFGLASYQLQHLIAPGGLFISIELFGVFASMIWMVWYLYTLAARILLFILDRF